MLVAYCLFGVLGIGTVCDFTGLVNRPSESFVEPSDSQSGKDAGKPLKTSELSLVVLRLGSPGKEGGDILGHLGLSGGGSVLVSVLRS